MRDKTREQILNEAEERIEAMVKGHLAALVREERELYLEEPPTHAKQMFLVGKRRWISFCIWC